MPCQHIKQPPGAYTPHIDLEGVQGASTDDLHDREKNNQNACQLGLYGCGTGLSVLGKRFLEQLDRNRQVINVRQTNRVPRSVEIYLRALDLHSWCDRQDR